MITNCELPLCMLDDNITLNDFDFVLFHLYKENKIYRDYYKQIRKTHPERLMIFDNSAYEFFVKGEKLNLDEFVESIKDLSPDFYILPDILQNQKETINQVLNFKDKFGFDLNNFHSKPLAVAQGNNSQELLECFDIYEDMGIEYIGIPFHLDFYKNYPISDEIMLEFGLSYQNNDFINSDDIRYAMGRVAWTMDNLQKLYQIKFVHFLGSHCPLEKQFYKAFESMDTGYPVKLGIEGIKLGEESTKPNIIIDDFLDKQLDDETKKLIQSNILTFKYV